MLSVAAILLAEMGRGFAGGPGSWWIVFPLLWLVLGTIAVVAIFRFRGAWRRPVGASAEDVLSERYARGQIGEDEYRERLAVLKERRS